MSRVTPHHAVVILAAGASRRLGTAKQLLSLGGESLINRTIRIAMTTDPQQILLVLGSNADEIFATINRHDIERIDCLDWQAGMSASLRTGIKNVRENCDGALIILCDQPRLTTSHLQSLVTAWRQQPEYAVASSYANIAGVPALLPRSWFDKIITLQGDRGARELLRSHAAVIRIEAPDLMYDIDSPQDLP